MYTLYIKLLLSIALIFIVAKEKGRICASCKGCLPLNNSEERRNDIQTTINSHVHRGTYKIREKIYHETKVKHPKNNDKIQLDLDQIQLSPHIRDIMYGWSRQRHPPVLYVVLDDDNIIITAICANDTNLHIPVIILIQSYIDCTENTSQFYWIQCNETKIIPKFVQNHFVILNKSQVGYYRVNYEVKNWHKITTYLQYKDHTCIPVQTRAQLIDDAYYFVMADKLNMTIFLNLIKYLKRETHYTAWYPMFNILYYLSAYWKLPESKFVKPIVLEILNSLLENIGYEEHSEDDGMTKTLRLLAVKWSCKLGDSGCRKAVSAKLHAKYISSNTKILPRWKELVYRMDMTQLNESTWHLILRESLQFSNTSTLKYLAYTDDIKLLLHYLDFLRTNRDITILLGKKQLTELYRFTLRIHLEKESIREHVLKNFVEITIRFYQEDKLILWGDIIWNLHSVKQVNEIVEFLKKVNISHSRLCEIRKLIEARKNELQKISKKFSHF